MEINGPLKIQVVEQENSNDWELLVDFRDEFRALDTARQGEQFHAYLGELIQGAASLQQDDPNLQGLLLVQQLAEQLLPHIVADELALNETITVQIARSDAVISLSDMLKTNPI